jgi:hypothetical protein
LWHGDDLPYLTEMLDPASNIGATPYCICREGRNPHRAARAQLFNLASTDPALDFGTTRVIRVYRRTGDSLELMHRIDWELPVSLRDARTVHDRGRIAQALAALKSLPGGVSHIVIKDLNKGAISESLVHQLREDFPAALWYASSKCWLPGWYKALPKDQVVLLLVPQLAAVAALHQHENSSPSWIIPGGQPSSYALDRMDELAGDFPRAHILVLPHGMSLLARPRDAGEAAPQGIIQTETGPPAQNALAPMASVLLPALVAQLIAPPDGLSFDELLQRALSFTNQWISEELKRLKEFDWKPTDGQVLDLDRLPAAPAFGAWKRFDWRIARLEWEAAFHQYGVIATEDPEKKRREIQLWRAMTEVDGYVACVPQKRKRLQILLEQGRSFGARGARRHKSLMLIDRPGSGKSFLVDRLAKALRMRLLGFNITQLLNRQDLLYCFDTIVTSQAQDPNEVMLVFVDEINARLDGQHVYDAFLAPLEDGIYIRSGNRFHIEPCLWVFAGTEPPVPSEQGEAHDKSDKGSDFVSRLTLPPLNLSPAADDFEDSGTRSTSDYMARMENIYIGVAAIRATFPDVRQVSSKVLRAFGMLPTSMGRREITRLVKHFSYIQYGRVTAKNMPSRWHESFKLSPPAREEWEQMPEEDDADEWLVDIRSEPGA